MTQKSATAVRRLKNERDRGGGAGLILRSRVWRDGLKVEVESLDSLGTIARDEEPTKKVNPLYTADQRTVEFFGCRDDN